MGPSQTPGIAPTVWGSDGSKAEAIRMTHPLTDLRLIDQGQPRPFRADLADKETGEKRTKDVVVVDNRFGEVGVSLKYVSARIERATRPAQAS